MKKTIILTLLMLTMATVCIGKPVDKDHTHLVAQHFFHQMTGKTTTLRAESMGKDLPLLRLYTNDDNTGFVIVAADDCVLPVLAFSTTNGFDNKTMPVHTKEWLEDYQQQIQHIASRDGAATPFVAEQWALLLSDNPSTAERYATAVSPLLTTTWNQSPYYNKLCPYDNASHARTVTGCVATATAQVMKYWNYPANGRGSHSYSTPYGTLSADFGSTTYNWSSMPSSLSSSSSTAQVNAVATLMYHVGIAVEMDYGVDGSSASTSSYGTLADPAAENALVQYFKYASSLHSIHYESCTPALWNILLQGELDAARPVIYSGRDESSGHCFVCDGYNNAGQYHFNWGWGGYCDGFYAIGELNPTPGGTGSSSSSTYNIRNQALIGIKPSTATSATSAINVTTNNSSLGTASGAGTYSTFGDTVTLRADAASGCRFLRWDDGSVSNPRSFVADGNMAFQAIFERLHGDTLGYSNKHAVSSYAIPYFGIRLPASVLSPDKRLQSVQIYDLYAGAYALFVIQGNAISNNNVVYTQYFTLQGNNELATVPLQQTVPIDNTQDLWIIFYNDDVSYPATVSSNANNSDGGWLSFDGASWSQLSDYGLEYTFIANAIFAGSPTTKNIAFTCSGSGTGTIASTGSNTDLCGQSDNVSQGATVSYYITPATNDTLSHLYIDGTDYLCSTPSSDITTTTTGTHTTLTFNNVQNDRDVNPTFETKTSQQGSGQNQPCANVGNANVKACGQYFWNATATTYTSTGSYSTTLAGQGKNPLHCDSTAVLNLTILSINVDSANIEGCETVTYIDNDGHTHTFNGADYTYDVPFTANPIYTGTNDPAHNQCQTKTKLRVTVKANSYGVLPDKHACDTLWWNNKTYTWSQTENIILPGQAPNGCDVINRVEVIIHPSPASTETITACDSYTWHNGSTYTNSTTGPKYRMPAAHDYGTIRCDSIYTLALTINNSKTDSQNATACDTYTWTPTTHWDTNHNVPANITMPQGTFNVSGIHVAHLKTAQNCDSTVTLNLTINNSTASDYHDTVCHQKTKWEVGSGSNYAMRNFSPAITNDSVGETLVIKNAKNCDSTITLNLKVYNDATLDMGDTNACDQFAWHGITYTTSGTKNKTISNAVHGVCDSIYRFTLHLYRDSTAPVHNDTVTANDAYSWRGTAYPTMTPGTTTYRDTVSNAVPSTGTGVCDSIYILSLTVMDRNQRDTVACDQFVYRPRGIRQGQTLVITHDTVMNDTILSTTPMVADSLVVWNVTVKPTYNILDTRQACDSLTWFVDGDATLTQTYTASTNTPSVVFHSTESGGRCDSVVTLHLTIHPSYNATNGGITDTLAHNSHFADGMFCGQYVWHDSTYTVSTDSAYHHHTTLYGCDSLVRLTVNIKPHETITQLLEGCGEYRYKPDGIPDTIVFTHDTLYALSTMAGMAANGCDIIRQLDVKIYPVYNHNDSVTACQQYLWANYLTPTAPDSLYTASTVTDPYTFHTHPSSSQQCDSVVTLVLTIIPNDTISDTVEQCQAYRYKGIIYTASAVVYDTLAGTTAANGCPVIGEHHIIIHNDKETFDTVDACYQYTWLSYRHETTTDTVGYFATSHGCDSTAHLHIVIHDSVQAYETVQHCGDTTWNGILMSEVIGVSQSYTATKYHLATQYGCDSTITVSLTVHSNAYVDSAATACDYYRFGTEIIDVDTTLRRHSPHLAENGCDSVTLIHLALRHSSYHQIDDTVCDHFVWVTAPDKAGRTYQGTFTQSVTGLHDTLYNADGCDSVLTLNLTVNHATSSTDYQQACDQYTWPLNGVTYTAVPTTAPSVTHVNAAGCDSTITLDLALHYTNYHDDTVQACDQYTWPRNGLTYQHSTVGAATPPMVTYTDPNGCDSVRSLVLTIHYSHLNAVDHRIACDSLEWHNVVYRGSTNTPTFSTHTAEGCDSLVTLDLAIKHHSDSTIVQQACNSFTWHGTNYTVSGIVIDTLQATNGCDSITTLDLTVNHTLYGDTSATACDSFTWYGTTYTAAYPYPTHQFTSSLGCDSIVTLHLTLNHTTRDTLHDAACDQYAWIQNGQTYTATTFDSVIQSNAQGCDFVRYLDLRVDHTVDTIDNYVEGCDSARWEYRLEAFTLTHDTIFCYDSSIVSECRKYRRVQVTVHHPDTAAVAHTACDGYEWTDGVTWGQRYTASGTYNHTFTNRHGCDSTVCLTLTINNASRHVQTHTGCDSLYWWVTDSTYLHNSAAEHNLTLLRGITNTYGCDSILETHIVVNHSTFGNLDTTVCNSLYWHGRHFVADTAGGLFLTGQNAQGCLQYDTLNLTVFHNDTAATETITTCDSFMWHNNTYTTSGTYRYNAPQQVCDSVFTLHLTLYATKYDTTDAVLCPSQAPYTWSHNGRRLYNSGTYFDTVPHAVSNVCDSIYRIDFTLLNEYTMFDTAEACDSYTWNGQTYTQSGTYRQHLTSRDGCDSIVYLKLLIHPSNTDTIAIAGCGSVMFKGFNIYTSQQYLYNTATTHNCDSLVVVNVTIYAYDTIDTVTVNNSASCDHYTWNTPSGATRHLATSGTYFDTVPGVGTSACGGLHRLDLTMRQSSSHTDSIIVCDSVFYDNRYFYNDTLLLTDRLVNRQHCDSLKYIQFHISPSFHVADSQTACNTYTWIDGNTYTTSTQTPTFRLTSHDGCDSVTTLHLTLNTDITHHDTISNCNQLFWNLTDSIYTMTTDQQANYSQITGHAAANGCDSLVVMHLEVRHSTDTIDRRTVCEQLRWYDNRLYTQDTVGPQHPFVNSEGCLSTRTLDLTVRHTATQHDSLLACDTAQWHGNAYAHTGYYFDTVALAVFGVCDSIYTLDLAIEHPRVPLPTYDTACDIMLWRGKAITLSGIYYDTVPQAVQGVCDSVYCIAATILHSDSSNTLVVEACDAYTWPHNNTTYTLSGTYSDTLQTATGCDSIITLRLTIHRPDTLQTAANTTFVSVCDTYTWSPAARTYSISTLDTIHRTNRHGCDSIQYLDLTIRHSTADTAIQQFCDTGRYAGNTYTADTLFETGRATWANAQGCDSIHLMHLVVNHAVATTDTISACDSLTWIDGNTYTADNNTAAHTFHSGCVLTQCDSTVYLDLTIRHSTTGDTILVGCDSVIYPLANRIFFASTDTTVNYTALTGITNADGCDSLLTLHITVNHSDNDIDSIVHCGPYRWVNGITYNNNITGPQYQGRNTYGCDSTVTLHLQVFYTDTTNEQRAVCDSLQWHGTTYTATGVYQRRHTGVIHGVCDSLFILDLDVAHTAYEPVLNETVCNSYTWSRTGNTYATSGRYTYREPSAVAGRCDSIYTLDLAVYADSTSVETVDACQSHIWHGTRYTASNQYVQRITGAVHGVCDSIYRLDLTLYQPDTAVETVSACKNYTWHQSTYNRSGTYYAYTPGAIANVCDQVHVLHLTIYQTRYDTTTVDACAQYTWRDHVYYQSGVYNDTIPSALGGVCDSVFQIRLTINPVYTINLDTSACNHFRWADIGRTFTQSTDTTYHFFTHAHCDSAVNLHLTIRNSNEFERTMHANECGSYTWPISGQTYTTSGNYTATKPSPAICDSTITLQLTIHNAYNVTDTMEACDHLTWQGHDYTQSGFYLGDTLFSDFGCDSIRSLQLTIKHATTATVTHTACDSYRWHGHTYTASTNTASYRTTNSAGCDSTVTLHLTIKHSSSAIANRTACDSYRWHGHTYTTSTDTAQYHTTNAAGCDSTVTLHLTLNQSTSHHERSVGCDVVYWDDTPYYASETLSQTFTNAAGCDSNLTVDIVVNTARYDTIEQRSCETYNWHGVTYTQSTTVSHTEIASTGCDSTTTLVLTIGHASTSTDTRDACDNLTWIDGIRYTTSTDTPTYTLVNSDGCDSVVHLDLTIRHSVTSLFTIQAAGSYTWNGITYTAEGDYQQVFTAANGCDSTATMHLVFLNFDAPQIYTYDNRLLMVDHFPNGQNKPRVDYIAYKWYRDNTPIPAATSDSYSLPNYQSLNGCFHVEVPTDNTKAIWVPSNVICIGVGIDDAEAGPSLAVMPNPAHSGATIQVLSNTPHAGLAVYDLQGRHLLDDRLDGEGHATLHLDVPAGIYTIRLQTDDGKTTVQKLVIR